MALKSNDNVKTIHYVIFATQEPKQITISLIYVRTLFARNQSYFGTKPKPRLHLSKSSSEIATPRYLSPLTFHYIYIVSASLWYDSNSIEAVGIRLLIET